LAEFSHRFVNFSSIEKMAQATSVNGIYLDDMESGWTIEDNTFESAGSRCMFIGGGRQNTVRNNSATATMACGGVPRFSLRIFDGRSRLNVCLLGDCEFVLRERCLRLWLAAFINCSTPVHVDSRGLGWMKCGDGQICKYTAARRCL